MKSLTQMDLDDWELLPDEGFLEINDDGSGKKIYSRNYNDQGSASVFQMNYFINAPESVEKTGHHHHHHQRMVRNQILPLQIDHVETMSSDPYDDDDREVVKREPAAKIPIEIKFVAPEASEMAGTFGSGFPAPDPDPISQVFFKKMKETEFVDMKMDSPRSSSATNSRFYLFEEGKVDSDMDSELGFDEGSDDGDEEGGLNLWKWSLNGIGAICSFGMAAATVCIIALSSHHKHRDRKLQFQIYTADKRMKQAAHHASRLNEAISAVRGVPITRARITFGGYYDAPL